MCLCFHDGDVPHRNSSVGSLVPFMAAFQDSQHAPSRVVLQFVFSGVLADLIHSKAARALGQLCRFLFELLPHVNQAKAFSLSAVST